MRMPRRWGAIWRVPPRTRIWFAVTVLAGLLLGWGIVWPLTGEISWPLAAIFLLVSAGVPVLVYRYRAQWRDEDGNQMYGRKPPST